MSDTNEGILTHMHLSTIEKWMEQSHQAQMATNESIKELSKNINELATAEKLRAERDERIQEKIKSMQDDWAKYEDGIKFAAWFKDMLNSYITRFAFPFVMTAIIILVAYNYGLPLIQGGK